MYYIYYIYVYILYIEYIYVYMYIYYNKYIRYIIKRYEIKKIYFFNSINRHWNFRIHSCSNVYVIER